MNKYFQAKYFFNSYIKGYWKEFLLTLQSLTPNKHKPNKKFVLFTGGRTGSTLLVSLLNNHPKIHCDDEILKGRVINPLTYLNKKAALPQAEIYGFKLLSYQLRDIQKSIRNHQGFLKKLVNQGYKIIYLERENKVYQSLSVLYAMQKDHWHSTQKKQAKKEKITLKVSQFEYMLQEIEDLGNFEKAVLRDLPFLRIRYEDDLENAKNHAATIKKISHYLEVAPISHQSQLRKLLPNNISRFVNNSTEIANYLKKAGDYEFVE